MVARAAAGRVGGDPSRMAAGAGGAWSGRRWSGRAWAAVAPGAGAGRLGIRGLAEARPEIGAGQAAQAAGGRTAGRADRSGRSASAGAGTAAQSRWRSLDSTGNVRLLSAEDLALEFPETRDRAGPAGYIGTGPREKRHLRR